MLRHELARKYSFLKTAHKQLVISAYQRGEAVAQKNAAVSEANLKYRDELQKKLETSLKKHDKKRKENLTKIVKT